jgi:hypothetical protein
MLVIRPRWSGGRTSAAGDSLLPLWRPESYELLTGRSRCLPRATATGQPAATGVARLVEPGGRASTAAEPRSSRLTGDVPPFGDASDGDVSASQAGMAEHQERHGQHADGDHGCRREWFQGHPRGVGEW